MKPDNIRKTFLGLSFVSLFLVTLKVLELGAVVRWDWIYLLAPFWIGVSVLVVNFVAKCVVAYTTLMLTVQILYADYQERMEPILPQELYENVEIHQGEVVNGS